MGKHYIVGQFSKKIARLVGRLGSGPRLVANGADVVFTHTPLRPVAVHCGNYYHSRKWRKRMRVDGVETVSAVADAGW